MDPEIEPKAADVHVAAEELEERVGDIQEAAEEAHEAEARGDTLGAEARLRQVEGSIADLANDIVELRRTLDGRALADHSHPLPGSVQTLADALEEIDGEEREPKRKASWFYRKIGR